MVWPCHYHRMSLVYSIAAEILLPIPHTAPINLGLDLGLFIFPWEIG